MIISPLKSLRKNAGRKLNHIRKFEFMKIVGDDDEAFAIIHVVTDDNQIIRNVEYFTFCDGKIKAIEVFFGGTGQGFPTNKRP